MLDFAFLLAQTAMHVMLSLPHCCPGLLRLTLWVGFNAPGAQWGLLDIPVPFLPVQSLTASTALTGSGWKFFLALAAALATATGVHFPQPICSLLSALVVGFLSPDHWQPTQKCGAMVLAFVRPAYPQLDPRIYNPGETEGTISARGWPERLPLPHEGSRGWKCRS
jgi:hypothetical protein